MLIHNTRPIDAPEPDYEDADLSIAETMECAELVMEVREAAGLLDWIAHNVDLPIRYLASFRDLDRRARDFDSRARAYLEAQS